MDSSSKRNGLEWLIEHLCRFLPQPFSGTVVQSILNHSNFLATNHRHRSLLWNVLAQQSIKILSAASLPACKWSDKVRSAVEFLIYQTLRRKLFPVVIGQSLAHYSEGFEVSHYGWTDQFRGFVGHRDNDWIPVPALDYRYNSNFMIHDSSVLMYHIPNDPLGV